MTHLVQLRLDPGLREEHNDRVVGTLRQIQLDGLCTELAAVTPLLDYLSDPLVRVLPRWVLVLAYSCSRGSP